MVGGVKVYALFWILSSFECLKHKNRIRKKAGVVERSAGARSHRAL